jgi:hypothetical protein
MRAVARPGKALIIIVVVGGGGGGRGFIFLNIYFRYGNVMILYFRYENVMILYFRYENVMILYRYFRYENVMILYFRCENDAERQRDFFRIQYRCASRHLSYQLDSLSVFFVCACTVVKVFITN